VGEIIQKSSDGADDSRHGLVRNISPVSPRSNRLSLHGGSDVSDQGPLTYQRNGIPRAVILDLDRKVARGCVADPVGCAKFTRSRTGSLIEKLRRADMLKRHRQNLMYLCQSLAAESSMPAKNDRRVITWRIFTRAHVATRCACGMQKLGIFFSLLMPGPICVSGFPRTREDETSCRFVFSAIL